MLRELHPGHLLDELLERADAAGQGDEGIRAFEHQALAGMHVGDDDMLLCLAQQRVAVGQELRDDAGDMAAGVEHGMRQGPHQTAPATAVDEADVVRRHGCTKRAGSRRVARIVAARRAAVDADIPQQRLTLRHLRARAPMACRGR